MKRNFNQKKGITLIALVVTIIVLLLLAGVSISMLTGQNGVLTRAAEAKVKTEEAEQQENQRTQEYEDTINRYVGEENLPANATDQIAGTQIKTPSSYGNKAKAIADGHGKYFALPTGDNVVYDITTYVDEGVVIKIDGNEFVWVPVEDVVLDKNDKNKIANLPTSSENDVSNGKTYTPMAAKIDDVNYSGILYWRWIFDVS